MRGKMLLPPALRPLPLGRVRPAGWLHEQLRVQGEGLTGRLDEFWPDVARSGWIGGDAEGWERGPYWLDGAVPLAFLLGDERLTEKVRRWADHILTHQQPDGWLGPTRTGSRQGYPPDPWPVYVALKALTQYREATGDERVVPAMLGFFRRLDPLLDVQPLRSWGRMRWADLVLSIHWLYDRTGETWLLDLGAKARDQGFDWSGHLARSPQRERCLPEECDLTTHVVNNAMAIKAPGVWFRQSGDAADRAGAERIIATLDRYHGQATGVFTGDEHLAGRSPSQGTELCAVVEYMYSLEVLLSILGDPTLGDRLERIAYNALPATISPDMWAHQYDQQVNQVVARHAEQRVYTSNGPDANLYGLAPNFGCCTANMHQGWPKLAASLWMRAPDDGLTAVVWAPCTVDAQIRGVPVRVEVETAYPFGEEIRLRVRTERPVRFPVLFRIPAWAAGAEVRVGDGAPAQAEPGGFHRVEREWASETDLTLRLPMPVQVERRYNGAVSIHRGPLLYALAIGEEWRLLRGEPPSADWEVYPTEPWNYALDLDPEHPARSLRFEARGVRGTAFPPDAAPVTASVMGRRVPGWGIERNAAAPPPASPVRSEEPIEELTLLPYGCTNLRVGELPVLER